LGPEVLETIKGWSRDLALALEVRGLINLQFAIQRQADGQDLVFIIEANPRASRTVPFVAKATGVPLAKIASQLMAGCTLAQLGLTSEPVPPLQTVKEAVLPFKRFPGADTLLGPEMRSTGEVMGVGKTFGEALFKSQLAAGIKLPKSGNVVLTVKDSDKPLAVVVAKLLHEMGFPMVATKGTAAAIAAANIPVSVVNKVKEGRPHIVDMIKNGEITLVFTTVDETRNAIADSRSIRTTAQANGVTYYTTISAARAVMEGMRAKDSLEVYSLQNLHISLS
jgi:carbamoyl-phosphate synthase large subunit